MQRVAITGLGIVSALGSTRDAFWAALAAGVGGIRPIASVDCSPLKMKHGAEVAGFDPLRHFDAKDLDVLDPFAQYALAAAAEAIADAGVELTAALKQRTAIVTGCGLGGKITEDQGFRDLYAEGKPRFHPMTIPRAMTSAGASHISMRFGFTGPALTVSTACSSANHALGQALWMVRSGAAEMAIAGGSEAPFSLGVLKAWEAMRVVAPDTCRPFSKDRQGLILGAGAGMLILEPWERAQARGARIYAELAGCGMTADAHHLTMPSASGAARAMSLAMADGGLAPEEIGYINAHGTGTPANDATETRAIREVFAAPPPVSSTKSMHGHAMGAAGALEAAATALALYHGILPPTANYTTPDPGCDLDVLPNVARPSRAGAALSNSFAFGGLNAVLAFRAAS
ncbi:MAG: beta-ketoacyl-[acyl-carrier-protein] synthase family protein [Bryobacteraceae bacterium]|nr:beta-ketoacyl-[acyl-carrier-protein] synthase family protein [Bryobacteraceae bacterium]